MYAEGGVFSNRNSLLDKKIQQVHISAAKSLEYYCKAVIKVVNPKKYLNDIS